MFQSVSHLSGQSGNGLSGLRRALLRVADTGMNVDTDLMVGKGHIEMKCALHKQHVPSRVIHLRSSSPILSD